MRIVDSDYNIAKIRDGISGDEHEFYFRTPTIAEREAYKKSAIRRKGKKIIIEDSVKHRVKFALKILTGFKKGSLATREGLFASDPQDEDYLKDWKDILARLTPELLEAVAITAFEGTRVLDQGLEIEGLEEARDMDEGPTSPPRAEEATSRQAVPLEPAGPRTETSTY